MTPELLAQVHQSIAPAGTPPSLPALICLTEQTILKGVVEAVMDYYKTHSVANPLDSPPTAIHQ